MPGRRIGHSFSVAMLTVPDAAPAGLARTTSMRSAAQVSVHSGGGRSAVPGFGEEAAFRTKLGLSRGGPSDAASDTSSVREQKIMKLLGGEDDEYGHGEEGGAAAGRNVGHRLYFTGLGRQRVKQERLRQERQAWLLLFCRSQPKRQPPQR